MDFALYDEQCGYYMNKNPIGREGDFITAPEISQIFGETIAIWVILEWEKLGKPEKFTIAELGPGKGTLMSDILRVTKKYFAEHVDIYMIEVSPFLQNTQKKTLASCKHNITWCEDILDLPKNPTIFVANEFFDALPIRQFICKDQSWYEKVVVITNDALGFSLISTDKSFDLVNEGSVLEINEGAQSIFNTMRYQIRCNGGAALMIDYGYTQKPYTSTLQAVKSHKYHDVLCNIGDVDITAHVDFSLFVNCKIMTQNVFLHLYGIRERAELLLKKACAQQTIMCDLHRLTHPESMGGLFKCAFM